ncbi:MAG: cupredoxin domain-containing protein [Dechloromonas sp.]|jgi:hypothetical protein|nr:cupredoxin domain-containing protein [Dechloromonas sp.]
MNRAPARLRRALAALAVVLPLAGSGPSLADAMPTYTLLLKGGKVFPETLEVPANTRFRLELRNEGPGAAEFESIELKKEKVLAPGVTSSLVFFPLKPGSYRFFDDFHPDTAQGRIVAK